MLATTTAALAQSINEIRVQQTGIDTEIYAEISGTAGTDLSTYTYLVIGNDDFAIMGMQNGYIESAIQLSGVIPASGFYVVAEPSYTLTTPDLFSFLDFQSDNNKTHMLVQNFTGSVGDIVDADQNGAIDTTFWSSISSSVALVAFTPQDGQSSDYVYSADTIGPDGGSFPSKVQRCPTTLVWQIGFADVSPTHDTPGAANPVCASGNTVVQLNEVRIDQQGTDNDEYAELSGEPGADLSSLTYLVIGDGTASLKSGVVECIIPLTGQTMPANGLFLITLKNTGGQDGIAFGKAGNLQTDKLIFENNDNVTHIIVRNYTGNVAVGQDLDTNDDGVLDVTPWTAVVDGVAVCKTDAAAPPVSTTEEWWYTPVVEAGGNVLRSKADGINPAAHVYRCSPQGSWKNGFFDPVAAGAANLDSPSAVNPECSNCGEAGSGSCFTAHAGPGCDNGACCSTVCTLLPACCTTAWDTNCTDTSFGYCLQGGSPPAIQLNEIRTSDESTRTANLPLNQYLEIVGPPNASLNGVTVVIINDQDANPQDPRGVVDAATKLDGLQLDSSGRFLMVENGFNIAGVTPNYNSGGGLALDLNKTGTVMLAWNFYGSRNDDLDTDNDGTLDTTPWISVIDSVSLTDGTDVGAAYSSTVVGPHNVDTVDRLPEHVYRCTSDGTWTMGPSAVTVGYDTPRADNADCSLPAIYNCGDGAAGDCFMPHDNAHCFNRACCEAVCDVAPDCCDVIWDQLCVDAAGTLTACGGGSPIAYLNEARFDEVNTDVDEYVEIKAEPGTDLSALTFIVVGDGSNVTKSGVIECVVPLTGQVVPESGLFVITLKTEGANPQDGIALDFPGDLQVATLNLENSDNLTLMLVDGFSGALNDDLDADDDGVMETTPWAGVEDSISIVGTVHAAPTGTTEEWWYASRIGPNVTGLAYHIYRCSPVGYWWAGVRDITNPDTITDRPGQANITCPGEGSNCFGDLDGSGEVDGGDIGLVLLDFGPCPGCMTDLDGSGEVDGGDIGLVLLSFGACQ
ncbi:MAG: hypothetical protein K8R92_09245 [Planctomycetes bacterium]|nr:hypothetical protein [Planctomycetota bacterium]